VRTRASGSENRAYNARCILYERARFKQRAEVGERAPEGARPTGAKDGDPPKEWEPERGRERCPLNSGSDMGSDRDRKSSSDSEDPGLRSPICDQSIQRSMNIEHMTDIDNGDQDTSR
jgi:hypothetical protein